MQDMWDMPMAIELDHIPNGHRMGAGIRITSGEAGGRQLYCLNGVGNVFLCDGRGEASNRRFRGVVAGDTVRFDNRPFLAYCYYYRPPAGSWLNYQPVIEQCLVDLAAWVEQGIEPAGSAFEYRDGKITLPAIAADRGGIQAVVTATANGAARVEVRVGEQVTLAMQAELPPGAGTIIGVSWDFDGSGTYPESSKVDGTASKVELSVTHRFNEPGTYFATVLVESHREGDVNATARRIPNLAAPRVVVS